MVFHLVFCLDDDLASHQREVIVDTIGHRCEARAADLVHVDVASAPMHDGTSVSATDAPYYSYVRMVAVAPSIAHRLIGVTIAVRPKEHFGKGGIIRIVRMSKRQRYRATDGETRLRVVVEIALGQALTKRDGLQRSVHGFKVAVVCRTWIFNRSRIHFLHDACQHSERFSAQTVVVGASRCDDAQPFSLAQVAHQAGIRRR